MKTTLPKNIQIFLATIWNQIDAGQRANILRNRTDSETFIVTMWETIKYFGWDNGVARIDDVGDFVRADLAQMNMSPEKFVQHLRDTLY
jgi:hypothetical protein